MRSRTFEEYRKKWDAYLAKNPQAELKADAVALKSIRQNFRNFLKTHRQFSSLERIHLSGRRISDKKQRLLIKNALKSESDFKSAVRTSIKILKKQKKALESHRQFIIDNFDDIAIFSNPIFFDKNLRTKLTDLGLTMREMRFYHNAVFNNVTGKVFKRLFEKMAFEEILDQSLINLDRLPFPESIETMKKRGMITIEGGEQAVPYIVGAAMVVGGVLLSIYGGPLAPAGMAVVESGLSLIVEEACQDITGTQDGYWSIGFNDMPLITFPISPQEGEPWAYFPWEVPPTPPTVTHPITIPTDYSGLYFGNHSPSKMEVHRVHCSWLHLIKPENIRIHLTLAEAHSAGLDNCFYCIGGSTR